MDYNKLIYVQINTCPDSKVMGISTVLRLCINWLYILLYSCIFKMEYLGWNSGYLGICTSWWEHTYNKLRLKGLSIFAKIYQFLWGHDKNETLVNRAFGCFRFSDIAWWPNQSVHWWIGYTSSLQFCILSGTSLRDLMIHFPILHSFVKIWVNDNNLQVVFKCHIHLIN